MVRLSKPWWIVAAFGQGMVAALAVVGGARLTYLAMGETLAERPAGNLWLFSSLFFGTVSVAIAYGMRKRADRIAAQAAPAEAKPIA